MPFQKGRSGNPRGKRPGTRHKATQAAQELLDGEAQELTRRCIDLAKEGNVVALRLCLERLVPPRKDQPINLKLPKVAGVGDIPKALEAILKAVAEGEITPQEGQSVAGMLGAYCKAAELVNHEARLEALESVLKLRKK
jgi:hypothetical protein